MLSLMFLPGGFLPGAFVPCCAHVAADVASPCAPVSAVKSCSKSQALRCGLVPVFMQEEEDGAASYASIDEVRELVHAIGLDPEVLKLSVRMERAVHDSLSKAAPTLRKSVRSAIELELSALDGPEPTGPVSKLGGVPWLKPDDQWPTCKCCGQPLAFFAQLNLGALRGSVTLPPSSPPIGIVPELSRSSGLLQLWGCTDGFRIEDPQDPEAMMAAAVMREAMAADLAQEDIDCLRDIDCEDATYDNPFRGTEFLRLVPQEELGSPTPPSGVPVLPTDLVSAVGVRAELGFEDSELREERWRVGSELGRFADWLEYSGGHGNWVGGWADWLQGPRYPECPKCSEPMTNVLFNWDGGAIGMDVPAIVTQCPKCPEQLAFLWDLD
ncbi:hypothetical protein EMIHUDRAFT_249118 [Emiliania huxleyi CCMP1516]|uniref:DUF1963 domain-containing protein n=2 Tax=Emiliania huxleyi TaxID=2903 RepID=A0A0D3IAM5_EMIH1|nr:hypothetical protein EMIHUDRAFT_249118 [Emiliania huxleyi CCMP1516]EOD08310.1 hypothetical protein EMIHUDRAFT_249118 [Emiliania huxleyi CCMP1516]|eukprot:XP_005760739.1 hypothetical protein EMIHUDRAFT_249118 [Emiliania huxleyi CCMP1516]